MKKTVFTIIVISLVVFYFVGCATQSNRADVWRDAASPNDYIGRWEGSVVQKIPQNEENFMPETAMEITIFFEYKRGEAKANSYMKIDLAQYLTDWSNMDIIMNLELKKESLWEILVEGFEETGEVTVGGEYFVTEDISDNVYPVSSDMAKFQVNESGNKMKLIFFQTVTVGMGETGFTEIILAKK
jgi:hypothetical protein